LTARPPDDAEITVLETEFFLSGIEYALSSSKVRHQDATRQEEDNSMEGGLNAGMIHKRSILRNDTNIFFG
jgi:hypothetical protein